MEKTVQTTASAAADLGHNQPLLHRNASVTKSYHLMPNHGHIFCWYRWFLSRPLHDDRFAVPVRALSEKTVQTTASSAADRGHNQPLLHRSASVTKSCHRMPNVTVTSFVGTDFFESTSA